MNRLCGCVLLTALAGPALGLDLQLPSNAVLTVSRDSALDSFQAPVGIYAEDAVPFVAVEGAVDRSAWRISAGGQNTLQLLSKLRAQIVEQGYEVVLDCTTQQCGGFDFRFAVEVLPSPNMYVNIRDYRYLTAVRGPVDAPSAVVALLVSSADTSAYVQLISVTTSPAAQPVVARIANSRPAAVVRGVAESPDALTRQGHVALRDIEFDTGTTALGAGPFASLAALAAYLKDKPGLRIALVGHTDSVGSLEGNIALSRDRAQAVRQRLISTYDIAPDRLEANGMGYLAPVASNLTQAGREANRRVEAVLLSDGSQQP